MNLDIISALSLAAALVFGIMGSPHILMRFFTVPDARAARNSAVIAATIVAVVFIMMFYIISVGAVALVTDNPDYFDAGGNLLGGPNMVTIHLAEIVGGEIFLGFISAIAFATILAVVSGLTLASASAVSHDLYANVLKDGKASEADEVKVSRIATIFIGMIAIALSIALKGQPIVVMLAIALAVAASANFPVLILCLYWKPLTTRGAIAGGSLGLVSSILLVVFGPHVWVGILGNDDAIFPYAYPAIFSMGWLNSPSVP